MVHGGVAHNAGGGDIRRGNPGPLCRACGQLSQSTPDAGGKLPGVSFHGVFDSGNHVRAELGLGVHAAGFAQRLPCDAVHQIGDDGGGAQIKGDDILVGSVGPDGSGSGICQNLGAVQMGKHQRQIPVHACLASQLLHAIHQHLALAAFSLAAAGGVRVQTVFPEHFQQIRAGRGVDDPVELLNFQLHCLASSISRMISRAAFAA